MGKQWNSDRFYFLGPPNHCRWWLQPWNQKTLTPLKKAMSNLESRLKRRHYFTDKDAYSWNYGFSNTHVWMWEWDHKEGWVPKNWCFWTVVFEKTLTVPWTARRSSQSILKEIYHECSLEGLRLKLKLQFFWSPNTRPNSLEKPQMLANIEGQRRRGRQMLRWLDGITGLMDMSWTNFKRCWRPGKPGMLPSMWLQRVRHKLGTE